MLGAVLVSPPWDPLGKRSPIQPARSFRSICSHVELIAELGSAFLCAGNTYFATLIYIPTGQHITFRIFLASAGGRAG
jgi:hypothetical protein